MLLIGRMFVLTRRILQTALSLLVPCAESGYDRVFEVVVLDGRVIHI